MGGVLNLKMNGQATNSPSESQKVQMKMLTFDITVQGHKSVVKSRQSRDGRTYLISEVELRSRMEWTRIALHEIILLSQAAGHKFRYIQGVNKVDYLSKGDHTKFGFGFTLDPSIFECITLTKFISGARGGLFGSYFIDSTPMDACRVFHEIMWQLARGLEWIHGRGVVHGALRPDAILLTPFSSPTAHEYSFYVKLTDFSLASTVCGDNVDPDDEHAELCVPLRGCVPKYQSPEISNFVTSLSQSYYENNPQLLGEDQIEDQNNFKSPSKASKKKKLNASMSLGGGEDDDMAGGGVSESKDLDEDRENSPQLKGGYWEEKSEFGSSVNVLGGRSFWVSFPPNGYYKNRDELASQEAEGEREEFGRLMKEQRKVSSATGFVLPYPKDIPNAVRRELLTDVKKTADLLFHNLYDEETGESFYSPGRGHLKGWPETLMPDDDMLHTTQINPDNVFFATPRTSDNWAFALICLEMMCMGECFWEDSQITGTQAVGDFIHMENGAYDWSSREASTWLFGFGFEQLELDPSFLLHSVVCDDPKKRKALTSLIAQKEEEGDPNVIFKESGTKIQLKGKYEGPPPQYITGHQLLSIPMATVFDDEILPGAMLGQVEDLMKLQQGIRRNLRPFPVSNDFLDVLAGCVELDVVHRPTTISIVVQALEVAIEEFGIEDESELIHSEYELDEVEAVKEEEGTLYHENEGSDLIVECLEALIGFSRDLRSLDIPFGAAMVIDLAIDMIRDVEERILHYPHMASLGLLKTIRRLAETIMMIDATSPLHVDCAEEILQHTKTIYECLDHDEETTLEMGLCLARMAENAAHQSESEDEEEMDSIVALFRKSLGLLEPLNRLESARVLSALASLHEDLEEYEEAKELYQKLLALRRDKLGEKHPSVATTMVKLVEVMQDLGENQEALPIAEEAVSILEHRMGSHPQLASALHEVAVIYSTLDQYDRALDAAEHAVQIRQDYYGDNDTELANMLSTKALALEVSGRLRAALNTHEDALQILIENCGETNPLVAKTLSDMAVINTKLSKYSQALALYRRSLEIQEEIFGQVTTQVSSTLSNMAVVLQTMENYDEAFQKLEAALEIQKKLSGGNEENMMIATSYLNLGHVNFLANEHEATLHYAQNAIRILQTIEKLQDMNDKIVLNLHYIATIYLERGRKTDDIMRVLDMAFDIVTSESWVNVRMMGDQSMIVSVHPHAVSIFCQSASILSDEGNSIDAIMQLKNSLFTLKELGLYSSSPKSEEVLKKLGELLSEVEEYDEAMTVYKKWLKLKRKRIHRDTDLEEEESEMKEKEDTVGEDHEDSDQFLVRDTEEKLALMNNDLNLPQVEFTSEEMDQTDDVECAEIHHKIGEILQLKGHHEEAIKAFDNAGLIHEKQNVRDRVLRGRTMLKKGQSMQAMDLTREAHDEYHKTAEMFSSVLGEDHDETTEARRLASSLSRRGLRRFFGRN